MKKLTLISKLSLILISVGFSANLWAAGAVITLPANIDPENTISLQKGATTYMNYCVACHSMKHMRYEALVEYLEIPEDIVEKNLMFSGDKVTDHITNNVPEGDSQGWFGKVPPDLTLIARVRGADWLYTYLTSFYEDAKRPFGVNNTVFKDVGMPHVLSPLQGKQVKTAAAGALQDKVNAANLALALAQKADDSAEVARQRAILEEAIHTMAELKHSGEYFEIIEPGSMTPEEYDVMVRDLVNFLDFAGEPGKLERHALGIKVIIFLLFFFVITYFLKKEYWRDIH